MADPKKDDILWQAISEGLSLVKTQDLAGMRDWFDKYYHSIASRCGFFFTGIFAITTPITVCVTVFTAILLAGYYSDPSLGYCEFDESNPSNDTKIAKCYEDINYLVMMLETFSAFLVGVNLGGLIKSLLSTIQHGILEPTLSAAKDENQDDIYCQTQTWLIPIHMLGYASLLASLSGAGLSLLDIINRGCNGTYLGQSTQEDFPNRLKEFYRNKFTNETPLHLNAVFVDGLTIPFFVIQLTWMLYSFTRLYFDCVSPGTNRAAAFNPSASHTLINTTPNAPSAEVLNQRPKY